MIVIDDLPTTFVWVGAYMQNWALGSQAGPRPSDDDPNTLIFSLPLPPSAKLPLLHLERDLGAAVEAIFSRDISSTVGKVYPLGIPTSLQDITSSFDRALASQGKKVVYHQFPDDQFLALISRARGEVIARDLLEMLKTFEDANGQLAPAGREDAVKTELGIELASWDDFLASPVQN
jgi:hypothetical protein